MRISHFTPVFFLISPALYQGFRQFIVLLMDKYLILIRVWVSRAAKLCPHCTASISAGPLGASVMYLPCIIQAVGRQQVSNASAFCHAFPSVHQAAVPKSNHILSPFQWVSSSSIATYIWYSPRHWDFLIFFLIFSPPSNRLSM